MPKHLPSEIVTRGEVIRLLVSFGQKFPEHVEMLWFRGEVGKGDSQWLVIKKYEPRSLIAKGCGQLGH